MRRGLPLVAALFVLGSLTAAPATAEDDSGFGAPESTGEVRFDFVCPADKANAPECRDGSLRRLGAEIEQAAERAFANADRRMLPLLKRDQAWAREWMAASVEDLQKLREPLEARLGMLKAIAEAHGGRTPAGTWGNAFGTATVTRIDDTSYRIEVATSSSYDGFEDQKTLKCHAQAVLKEGAGGWLAGPVAPDAETFRETPPGERKPPVLRARLQGGTLRVVAKQAWDDESAPLNCTWHEQITGTYFATAKSDNGPSPFVPPSFDCAKPGSASEEEICADPELAANDVRLNQAWKTLLPRLDADTRKLLTQDQRGYVKSQASKYSIFLHPGWDKMRGDTHHTGAAREELLQLQRERIAMLDGFDDKRSGLEGLWLAYNALIQVKREPDGKLKAVGWKWEQGDWKMRCDYEMSGAVTGGVFRSDERRLNPDTLERDHASLIVNRADDEWAKTRSARNGTPKEDEQKCTRQFGNSSTARLFPVRPSPDINTKESIR